VFVEGTLNVAGTLNVGNISLTATAECGAVGGGVAKGRKAIAGTADAGVVASATVGEIVPLLRRNDYTVQGTGAVND
jgi:hypothetical protein